MQRLYRRTSESLAGPETGGLIPMFILFLDFCDLHLNWWFPSPIRPLLLGVSFFLSFS